ncbi:HlyD family secretion protein [Brevibacillus humidisoli]|uniref:HlyD family secretion protein n=1 Tax=Brevibacillus humidisoli TaxID=2895522 RepID=UPI001E301EAF|nr:HlyD family secretion protein [Brevibacillus humidisoli]UFJ39001.1 HlyD family secretion protein [Brevibacillus humidisoli]
MKRKLILYVILLLFVAVIGAIGAYYWYVGEHYVTTEDARVSGDIYRVVAKTSGKLTSLDVAEGDQVVVDQVIGRQETTNLSTDKLDNATLRAPISGTIIKTLVKEGEVVAAGQAVAMIVDDRNLYIDANIEETQLTRLRIGQSVDISIDAYPNQSFTGTVSEIGQATNSTFSLLPSLNTSGNFTKITQRIPVKISLDDQQESHLAPGLSAVIKIIVKGN